MGASAHVSCLICALDIGSAHASVRAREGWPQALSDACTCMCMCMGVRLTVRLCGQGATHIIGTLGLMHDVAACTGFQ